jgi:hypothetical protein
MSSLTLAKHMYAAPAQLPTACTMYDQHELSDTHVVVERRKQTEGRQEP